MMACGAGAAVVLAVAVAAAATATLADRFQQRKGEHLHLSRLSGARRSHDAEATGRIVDEAGGQA